MPETQEIQETLAAPLAALEVLLMAPAQALKEGVQQLKQSAQRSGLPRLPDPPELPKVFRR